MHQWMCRLFSVNRKRGSSPKAQEWSISKSWHLHYTQDCTLNEAELLITMARSDMFDVNSKNKENQNSNPLHQGFLWSLAMYSVLTQHTLTVSWWKENSVLRFLIDNGSWLYLTMKHRLFSLFITNSEEEDSIFYELTTGWKWNSLF